MNSAATSRGISVGQLCAPYLLRDRDQIFGREFTEEVRNLGIWEVLGAPHAPRQRASPPPGETDPPAPV